MIIGVSKYPDGTSYAKFDLEKPNSFTYKVNTYEDLWHLNQIVDAYNNQGLKPIITIPWLIDGQADRRFNEWESSGLKLVCDFLNRMNATFKIFHPHNPEVVEALMDNVKIIDNTRFISYVLQAIKDGDTTCYPTLLDDKYIGPEGWFRDVRIDENLILMSSDAGGFKPLMKLCDKIGWVGETASASKARSYEDGKTTLHQIVPIKDFDGKDILIIDDICVYGGTFKGLSKLLKTRNCGKLYLAVSHMTVQNLGEDSVTNYFNKVFTTSSKYNTYFSNSGTGYGGAEEKNLEIMKFF